MAKDLTPEHAEVLDLVDAFSHAWSGPVNDLLPAAMQPVHLVAHQHPGTGVVSVHMHALPEQIAYLLAAVRAYGNRGEAR